MDTTAIDKIEKQFKVLDRNGDGLITIAEMRKSLNVFIQKKKRTIEKKHFSSKIKKKS